MSSTGEPDTDQYGTGFSKRNGLRFSKEQYPSQREISDYWSDKQNGEPNQYSNPRQSDDHHGAYYDPTHYRAYRSPEGTR
jgi:hypothetical protein